jgi:hypothetical protein
VFENRVLRRILEPEREEVARGWKRLNNVELHNLMGRACSTDGRDDKCVQYFG